jgi:TnpA family transposase
MRSPLCSMSARRAWPLKVSSAQEKLETSQLAVDTHGYTDFAMSHARLLGFDLCPRLKELKQRHLFVPRGTKVPAEIAAVCEANVDVALIEKHWDSLVHLAASVMSGTCQCGGSSCAVRFCRPGRSNL